QEYQAEIQQAQIAKEAYEANNKDKIDETNVPMADAAGIEFGKKTYDLKCKACHGVGGEGTVGPNLTDDYWIHKGSLNDIYNTIKVGYSDKGMQSWAADFTPKEISNIASFIKTLKGTKPANPKAPQGDLYSETATASNADTSGAKVAADTTKVKK
ncbi:MAG: c-type cytochrome, partial [Ferruginibacter sp.]|nr:c-type cytochrome [Ferruginibacter sp.]